MTTVKRRTKKKAKKKTARTRAATNGNDESNEHAAVLMADGGPLKVTAPRIETVTFEIVGTAPYVQSKFSQKALEIMRKTQEAGSTAKKGSHKEPKDFKALFEGAIHYSEAGWAGIPANGIRAALVSACRTVGFKMTLAKLSVFVEADGFDATEGTPLVKITKGTPRHVEHAVRIQNTTDIRVRALWKKGWRACPRIRFDRDQFTRDDVANLLLRVGMQVGLGEGRPDSRSSAGMGWGTFVLAE